MKWLAAIALLLAVTWTASGQQVNDVIPRAPGFATLSTNYTVPAAVTNATPNTNLVVQVDMALYHTLHFSSTTNSMVAYVDKSLTGTTYVTHSTNVVAAGTAQEVALTGKWAYIRVRTAGTNIIGGVISYLGGR